MTNCFYYLERAVESLGVPKFLSRNQKTILLSKNLRILLYNKKLQFYFILQAKLAPHGSRLQTDYVTSTSVRKHLDGWVRPHGRLRFEVGLQAGIELQHVQMTKKRLK